MTGYAQTLRETHLDADTEEVTKTVDYTFGHDEISQTVTLYDSQGQPTSSTTHVFGHDGHGSVRVLFDMAAAIVQMYAYEAYGNLLAVQNATGVIVGTNLADALTTQMFNGEQVDRNTQMLNLRDRWYQMRYGTFDRADRFSGNLNDPQSLHKYLFVHGDPINGTDPTGMFPSLDVIATLAIQGIVRGLVGAFIGAAFTGIIGGIDASLAAEDPFEGFVEGFINGAMTYLPSLVPAELRESQPGRWPGKDSGS